MYTQSGVTDIRKVYPALQAMARVGMPLLVHGEVTDAEVGPYLLSSPRHLSVLLTDGRSFFAFAFASVFFFFLFLSWRLGASCFSLRFPLVREHGSLLACGVYDACFRLQVDIFDREAVFIERHLAPLIAAIAGLKVVMEHITTEVRGRGAHLSLGINPLPDRVCPCYACLSRLLSSVLVCVCVCVERENGRDSSC